MRSENATPIPGLVLEAVADPQRWAGVLQSLIDSTGALAGVIILRDCETAELLLPDKLDEVLSAPLIQGLSPDAVASYIDHYDALDPWTRIEQDRHPTPPYFMSDHLPVDELRQTEFWAWLEPQGISDALVAEVHATARNWVALNLHFGELTPGRKHTILQDLAPLLVRIREGWRLSQELVTLRSAVSASNGYLERWPMPCLSLDNEFTIMAANTHATSTLRDHVSLVRDVTPGAQLDEIAPGLEPAIRQLRDHASADDAPGQHVSLDSAKPGHFIRLTRIAQARNLTGLCESIYFLHIGTSSGPSNRESADRPIWENPALTKRQRAIVRWVAEGGEVPEFAQTQNIAAGTAYDHLLAARRKLDGLTARDIYAMHQAYLLIASR